MNKQHRFSTLLMLALALAGVAIWYFTRMDFLGGFLTGIAVTILLLVWIGRRQANKAAELIDKKIMDIYQNSNR